MRIILYDIIFVENDSMPEWMTDGPTSQLDTMELFTHKDIEEEKKGSFVLYLVDYGKCNSQWILQLKCMAEKNHKWLGTNEKFWICNEFVTGFWPSCDAEVTNFKYKSLVVPVLLILFQKFAVLLK